ncbi:hypothetical protein HMPREF9370_1101 [Neisseria wadsworthii 9715]|uniref:Uncharacterized protein n=1 Tax=Neisseria wadsworthii 9715 TaxID=1030841 RepID=G4CPU1_9NEIS|nr:hypothetical protein HMPREF9370_1101 [Neisseria wadsworthii 9715]
MDFTGGFLFGVQLLLSDRHKQIPRIAAVPIKISVCADGVHIKAFVGLKLS